MTGAFFVALGKRGLAASVDQIDNSLGKVIRITHTVAPADGHRNPQGLVRRHGDGALWLTEDMGPGAVTSSTSW